MVKSFLYLFTYNMWCYQLSYSDWLIYYETFLNFHNVQRNFFMRTPTIRWCRLKNIIQCLLELWSANPADHQTWWGRYSHTRCSSPSLDLLKSWSWKPLIWSFSSRGADEKLRGTDISRQDTVSLLSSFHCLWIMIISLSVKELEKYMKN